MTSAVGSAAERGGRSAAPARTTGPRLDRSDWLEWRRRGIGASDIAAIVGVSPWQSPWSIWATKVGLAPDDDDATAEMTFGLDLEPVIIAWFERRHPGLHVRARQALTHHPSIPWVLATLDGLVLEEGSDDVDAALAVFESKYDSGGRWDDVPEHYRLQVQWQLLVTGLDLGYLAVMHLAFGRPRFEVYELARDQRLIDDLLLAARQFWIDHVVAGIPPFADGHPATSAALADAWIDPVAVPAVAIGALELVVDELRELRAARKLLEADIERDENILKAALGCHTEGVVDGQVVVSWRQQPRTDIDRVALRADHGDRYDTRSAVRVLRLHTPRTRRSA